MEILLNREDYSCYTADISTVAPQNFIKFLHQKAEVLILLVIMHLSLLCMSLFHSGQLISASSVLAHFPQKSMLTTLSGGCFVGYRLDKYFFLLGDNTESVKVRVDKICK